MTCQGPPLLDAVASAVAEVGVSGLSLRDIARRAGVSGLWISGRLSRRTTEQDQERLARRVCDLFVETVLTD